MNEKDYFVFDGQNASTGEPNRVTGRMSFYGEVLKFHSKKEAKQFEEESRSTNLCIAGTKSKMRGYCLGMSVSQFEEYLYQIDYRTFDIETMKWE